MSCIPPIYYKQRFYNYLNTVFSINTSNNIEIKNNNNNTPFIKKELYKVDRYGAISSSRYKQYLKEEEEKDTIEDSLQKF